AVLSHELRTPLNAILGFTQLLRSGALDPEESASALETIERNARTQHQLIADLLDVSRIVQGEMRLEMAKCDLPGVIRAGIEALRPAAEARGIEVRVAFEDVPAIRADGRRVQQIVWNLMSNAIKFSHRGGAVDVELRHAGEGVEILVSDSGVGIEADFLPYVFERFRQADSSSTRQYGGRRVGPEGARPLAQMH